MWSPLRSPKSSTKSTSCVPLPVPDAELLDAQNYLTGVFSMGLATQSGLLSQISTLALNELPDEYLETYREKVRALKPEDVMAAARTYFDSANMQIVVVGDRKHIESQAALFGELRSLRRQGRVCKSKSPAHVLLLEIRTLQHSSSCMLHSAATARLRSVALGCGARRRRATQCEQKTAAASGKSEHCDGIGIAAGAGHRSNNG